MFLTIYKQEVRRHLGEPMLYISSAFIFLMTFLFAKNTNPDNVILLVRLTREWHNAPLIIAKIFAVWGGMGLLVTMVMSGKAIVRDFLAKTQDFYLTSPVSKTEYLMGRFWGSLTANLLVFAGMIAGYILGCLSIDAAYYGPFTLSGFLVPLLFIAIPNLFIAGSLFFSLATLTRRMIMTYVVGIAFLLLTVSVSALLTQLKIPMLRALSDPFGYAALAVSTTNWTIADINSQAMPVSLYLILNRVVWCGLGTVALCLTMYRFKMHSIKEQKASTPAIVHETAPVSQPRPRLDYTVPVMTWNHRLVQTGHWIGRELGRILKHPAYIILTILGAANVYSNFVLNVDMAGSRVQPLTSWFLAHTNIAWGYMIPLTILFGGMIVWRERDNCSHPFYDVLPLPSWMAMTSKLAVLVGMQTVYLLVVMMSGILSQLLIFQFTDIQLGLYVQTLFGIEWVSYIHMAIVVVTIQNLSSNKTLGFFLSTMYFVLDLIIFPILGFDQIFLRYGHTPAHIYSGINGFGHYSTIILWYTLYWLLFAGLFLGTNALLWRRNEETHLKFRFIVAKRQWRRSHAWSLGILAGLYLLVGGHIISNKFVANNYYSRNDLRDIKAEYEKAYSPLIDQPQPLPVHIKLGIDFYPEDRACRIHGHYQLRNKSNLPMDSVLVNLSDRRISNIHRMDLSLPSQIIHQNSRLGMYIYQLDSPLEPGEEMALHFDLEFKTQGFTENNPKNELAANGSSLVLSVFGWSDFFPMLGYSGSMELGNKIQRAKRGLPDKAPWLSLEEIDQLTYGMGNAFVTYDATVSTSEDQTVVANGNLIREWHENGRNHYHFTSETPMVPEFNFTSQNFTVKQVHQNDRMVEVYYNPSHHYNVDRILQGTADALAYGDRYFTRYPYSVIRVQENNEYMGFGGARALPSLVQWRESAGFISRLDEDAVDMIYFIAAHEMAHQWWGVTMQPAAVEGAVLATEMLAQYTATRCFENRYGQAMTRRLLKLDMNGYLSGRKRDVLGERIMLHSYFNRYMTYDKSNVVMYALKEYIGEEAINNALKSLLERFNYREKDMVTSIDVVDALRKVTPDSLQYLVTDFFDTITLWENKAVSANAEQEGDGRYHVKLALETHKFRADSIGTQTEISIGDYMPVMVFGKDDKVLYNEMVYFDENMKNLEIIVDEKPLEAGLDPYLLLIDRKRDDNRVPIKLEK
ncbi:hypothetical protein KAR48_12355 [bacterium]|nr:hypothetical protein [bacterium]